MTWLLTYNADLHLYGWGYHEDGLPRHDLDERFSDGATYLNCAAGGTLSVHRYLRTSTTIELRDARIPGLHADFGPVETARRTQAIVADHVEPEPRGVPFRGFRMDPTMHDPIFLTYAFDRCPDDLLRGADEAYALTLFVEVTYQLLGRTHTQRIELPQHLIFASCEIEKIKDGSALC